VHLVILANPCWTRKEEKILNLKEITNGIHGFCHTRLGCLLSGVPTRMPLCQPEIEEERQDSRQDTRLLVRNMHRDGFAELQCSTG